MASKRHPAGRDTRRKLLGRKKSDRARLDEQAEKAYAEEMAKTPVIDMAVDKDDGWYEAEFFPSGYVRPLEGRKKLKLREEVGK